MLCYYKQLYEHRWYINVIEHKGKAHHFFSIAFPYNTYKATSGNSFLLKQDLTYSIKQILTWKCIKWRKCMLCKLWMDAQTYRWETNECFYWPPIICQPVTDKINIRKVTNYYVPWCCKGLQGLLKKNLCSLSGVFLFWQISLKSCPKSLSSSAFINLRKQPCT